MLPSSWSSRLNLGIPSIDADHQYLVNLLDRLQGEILGHGGRAVVARTLDELDRYAERHFAMEEELFVRSGYPDAEAHIREHRALARRVAEFREVFAHDEDASPIELLEFMRAWITRHVVETDAKYVELFRATGVV